MVVTRSYSPARVQERLARYHRPCGHSTSKRCRPSAHRDPHLHASGGKRDQKSATLRVRDSFTPHGGRFPSCSPEGEQYFLDTLPESLANREALGTGPVDFDNDVIS